MRVALGIQCQHSFFSSGHATCVVSLAEALKAQGHDCVLVNFVPGTEWFEDCRALKTVFPCIPLKDTLAESWTPCDIFVDVDGYVEPKTARTLGTRVVRFLRRPVAFHLIETCVYPIVIPRVHWKECDAIWMWEHFGPQDAHLAELLSEKPVFRIPFLWSSAATDVYRAEESLREWALAAYDASAPKGWNCHITETNQSNTSNCTLPLVILYALAMEGTFPLDHVAIHNAHNLETQEFFQKNVLEHTAHPNLKRLFVGRQRCADWIQLSKSFVLAHQRFQVVKPFLLDCLWNGIPVVHNSPWLAERGLGWYYPDNSVSGALVALKAMNTDFEERRGFFAPNGLGETRRRLAEGLSISPRLSEALTFERSVSPETTSVSALPLAEPKACVSPLAEPKACVSPKACKTLRIGFCDLWQDANHTYNFWTLLLEAALPSWTIEAFEVNPQNATEPMDGLFFGPFGSTWTTVPSSVPKIHISGENTPPHAAATLNLGFAATDVEKGVLRVPLWLQYLDWFGADQTRLQNPRTMPLETIFCEPDLREKSKFCAFVVSNPTQPLRGEAFTALSTYKHVDSAGRYMNNVGSEIFTENGGGGGGELAKLAFLKPYRFCLAFENNASPGYVTEKMLAAKAAGCVPIYWGAPDVLQDFCEGSFVWCQGDISQMVSEVAALDTEGWEAVAKKPLIVGGLDRCRQWLSVIAKTVVKTLKGDAIAETIPDRLGNTVPETPSAPPKRPEELLVTFCSTKFLPSLQLWIHSILKHCHAVKGRAARVYLGHDVRSQTRDLLAAQFPDITFLSVPTDCPPDFPDFWEPQHFAWKIWIYKTLSADPALKGTLVWYMDCGSILIRWPTQWMDSVHEHALCFLEDTWQVNERWCHAEFCKALSVTAEEKAQNQVVGGIVAFVAGEDLPMRLFAEAFDWAQKRHVIVGPKWGGLDAHGRPTGHRHDQSILSILARRYKTAMFPLDAVYCAESVRRTYKSGAAIYVHRGAPEEHTDFAPRIGEVHICNLARRQDRLAKFKEHGEWTKQVCLRPSVDGRTLSLTPALARLFAPNDFLWKKAIAGCALTHMSLWAELAAESPACDTYLILEDDVKFREDWLQIWNLASKEIPDDFDVLYLGGVLPPNRPMFQQTLEPVNSFWARVAPNQIFGQPVPTRYFHFCNYAYVLRRRAAKVILEDIQTRGYTTSADHMVCNRVSELKHYVLQPMVAGCYQDEDPTYQQSAFNNFNRVDAFDSDLWNNDDRFSQEEIIATLETLPVNAPIDIGRALADTRQAEFLTVDPHFFNRNAQLEAKWLSTLFSRLDSYRVVPQDHEPQTNTPCFIISKPFIELYTQIAQRYENAGRPFTVLHLSDEGINDCLDIYTLSMCTKVWRTYPRPLEPDIAAKVVTLPLGYTNTFLPQTLIPLSSRPLIWSFHGTAWKEHGFGRSEALASLQTLAPYEMRLFDKWMDPTQQTPEVYHGTLARSMFVPCLRGNNNETFRFYEALEHGCIPIYIINTTYTRDMFFECIKEHLPIMPLASWEMAAVFMKELVAQPATLEQYGADLQEAWKAWKASLRV